MKRGHDRKVTFHDDRYYQAFLETIKEACSRFCMEVHAYCRIGNHYHLLIKTP
ncbi:MAG: transposase [Gammaproteobacteria bacterium]|nr:transposase [Gammaproteobacteria bacterium]